MGLRVAGNLHRPGNRDHVAAALASAVNSIVSLYGAWRRCGLAGTDFTVHDDPEQSLLSFLSFRARRRGLSVGPVGDRDDGGGFPFAALARQSRAQHSIDESLACSPSPANRQSDYRRFRSQTFVYAFG